MQQYVVYSKILFKGCAGCKGINFQGQANKFVYKFVVAVSVVFMIGIIVVIIAFIDAVYAFVITPLQNECFCKSEGEVFLFCYFIYLYFTPLNSSKVPKVRVGISS